MVYYHCTLKQYNTEVKESHCDLNNMVENDIHLFFYRPVYLDLPQILFKTFMFWIYIWLVLRMEV